MSAFDLFVAAMLIGESLLALVLAHRLRKANKRIEEMLDLPFAYWERREMLRRLAERCNLDGFKAVRMLPLGNPDKPVKFCRPQPFEGKGY